MSKFDQAKYIFEYNRAHYDAITIRFPAGGKELIKAKAAERGMSVAAYLWLLVKNDTPESKDFS